jgi:hypothetical protein
MTLRQGKKTRKEGRIKMSPRYRPSEVNSDDIDDIIYGSPLVSVDSGKIAPFPANESVIYSPAEHSITSSIPEFPCTPGFTVGQGSTTISRGGAEYVVNSADIHTLNTYVKEEIKNEGLKYDEGKEPLDLIPTGPLFEVARVLAFGAKKYERYNWRKGMQWSRVAAASLRHIYKWLNGETIDPETGCNHLAHAAVNLLFLLEYKDTHTKKDDRYSASMPQVKP